MGSPDDSVAQLQHFAVEVDIVEAIGKPQAHPAGF